MTGARRLSQAISEGDGISIIALVGDADAARAAEDQGAEGVAVRAGAAGVREATSLPILFRVDASPQAARDAGADACLIVVEEHGEEEHLEELHALATGFGLEIVADVHDEVGRVRGDRIFGGVARETRGAKLGEIVVHVLQHEQEWMGVLRDEARAGRARCDRGRAIEVERGRHTRARTSHIEGDLDYRTRTSAQPRY